MILSLFKNPANKTVYPLNWVTSQLAVGHAPKSYPELDSLKKQGIKAIMNLCLEMEALAQLEQEEGFEVYYLPIMDEEAPDLDALEAALDWLDEAIYLGKRVLVHCRHGIGRTGTVVFAYLLRKGLGRKRARKKMRGLRSQPTEQPQKQFLHQFGKKEGALTISEPSLGPDFKIELRPYLDQVAATLEELEARIPEDYPRCGREHTKCCFGLVRLSLAEAVFLQSALNTELSSGLRQACINQALMGASVYSAISEEEGPPAENTTAPSPAFAQTGTTCPLLKDQACLLFASRPVQCRLADSQVSDIPTEVETKLSTISRQILELFAGRQCDQAAPAFTLFDVVSGKFVQSFFHLLAKPGNGR